jgi:hypothetical protein
MRTEPSRHEPLDSSRRCERRGSSPAVVEGLGMNGTWWRIGRNECQVGGTLLRGRHPTGRRDVRFPRQGGGRGRHGPGSNPERAQSAAAQRGRPCDPGDSAGGRGRSRLLLLATACGCGLAGALGTGVSRRGLPLRLVAQPRRVPAFRSRRVARGRAGGVGGRLDVVRLSPGPVLFRREAAARPPALLSTLAAASVVLAGEGDAADRGRRGRDGKADGGDEVGRKGHAGANAPGQPSPEGVPPGEPHEPLPARCLLPQRAAL